MGKGASPKLIDRVGTPLFFVVGGVGALSWFAYRVYLLFVSSASEMVVFDKGSYYMLGAGIGMLSLAYMIIKEFWVKRPLSRAENRFLSRLAVSGVVLLLVFPQVAHYNYFKKNGYSVCHEASRQWLFIRDIVYIRPALDCNADIKPRSISLNSISDYAIDSAIRP